jgi:hypothetical protein
MPVRELHNDHGVPQSLHAMRANAKDFGLSDDEVWTSIDECVTWVGPEATVGELLEELTGALAFRILAKQRAR